MCVYGRACVRVSVCASGSVCARVHGGKAFGSHSLISMWPLPGGETSLLARCVRVCVCLHARVGVCVCLCVFAES